jgi:hypothetical protein
MNPSPMMAIAEDVKTRDISPLPARLMKIGEQDGRDLGRDEAHDAVGVEDGRRDWRGVGSVAGAARAWSRVAPAWSAT